VRFHDGTWAELIVVPEDNFVARMPAGVELAEAGAAPLAAVEEAVSVPKRGFEATAEPAPLDLMEYAGGSIRKRVVPVVAGVIVVVAAIALYALLPEQLILGPRLVIPALEVVLLVALSIVDPRRMTRDHRYRSRRTRSCCPRAG